jgi:flagellar biosynthesis GTPase FlhF
MQPAIDGEALRSLAQYLPFGDGGRSINLVHDDLIAAACQSSEGGFSTLEACRSFIKSTWKIELEISEIQAARDRLKNAGSVESRGGAISITPQKELQFDKERNAWERAEQRALEDWELAVRRQFPFLSSDDLQTLKEQLRPWLDHVILRHGAEASLLLYSGDQRAKQLLDSLAKSDLEFLPECSPALSTVRAEAFRMFVREPTEAQLGFLSRLLNTGFYRTVLSLDPRARHLAQAEASQTTLYLDTNFLYAVLGVGNSIEAHTANRLLDLCSEMGYGLRVTPWTIDELRTSIANSRADVLKMRRSRKAAVVMADASGERGFAPAYWRALRDKGTNPAEFFGQFDHFKRYLESRGIREYPDHCLEIEEDLEAIRAYASPIEGMYGPGTKRREVIEHDAKSRLLIERLREGTPAHTYADVRYWFLTESTRLPTYGLMPIRAARRPKFPFCILASTWAQIVRSFVPRTEDLDEVIVGLLASPYVGHKTPALEAHRLAVERVVRRIDGMRDMPPSVAIAMVNDEAMASKIGEETDEEEVGRLVEESLTQKAHELEAHIAANAELVAAAEKEKEQADERAASAAKSQSDSEEERDRAKREAEEANLHAQKAVAQAEEAAKQGEELKSQVETAEHLIQEERTQREAADQRREAAEQRAERTRNRVAVVVGLAAGMVGTLLLASGAVTGEVPVVAVVSFSVLVAYFSIRFISNNLAKEIRVAVSIIVGIATIIGALWPASGGTGHESKTPNPADRDKERQSISSTR